MFEKCCDSPNKQKYDIKHMPQPIELNESLLAAIERLLWYVPNIDSKQSPKNDLLMNSLYGDYYLGIILEKIGIGKQDILWTKYIDPDLVKEYQKEVCINCQKLILKIANRPKIDCFFRHVRNCIAHGNFNLSGGMLIGFDTNKKNSQEEVTAVIKIKPEALLKAIEDLSVSFRKPELLAYAFDYLGYKVIYPALEKLDDEVLPTVHLNYRIPVFSPRERWDLVLEKNGVMYYLEIKNRVTTQRYITKSTIDAVIDQFNRAPENCKRVLVFDTEQLTKDAQKILASNEIQFIDIKALKQVFQGIDVLGDLNQ